MDLTKIWKARKLILEGITNTVFKKQFVEDVYQYRLDICKKCEHYNGECEVPGSGPCCGACGCSLKFKLRSLSSACGLEEIDEDPLWLPVMKQNEEDEHLGNIEE